MLDPAIIHDLQRAMVPPSLPPLAIMREWTSPLAEQAERDWAPILAAAEVMVKEWCQRIDTRMASLLSKPDLVWTEDQLAKLDRLILDAEAKAENGARSAARAQRREHRQYADLLKLDASIAKAQRRHSDRIAAMRKANVDQLLEVALQLRAYRSQVDTRLGPSVTFENPTDLAAFLEAAIAA